MVDSLGQIDSDVAELEFHVSKEKSCLTPSYCSSLRHRGVSVAPCHLSASFGAPPPSSTCGSQRDGGRTVSYTHLRAHETRRHL
eukprot:4301316-Prorocentrum_lima.AAC.1